MFRSLFGILDYRPRAETDRTDLYAAGPCSFDSKTGVLGRGQRALLTRNVTAHANTWLIGRRHASEQAVLAIQVVPSGKNLGSCDIAVAARLLQLNEHEFHTSCHKHIFIVSPATPFWPLVSHLVRPSPYRVVSAGGESFGICRCFIASSMSSHDHPISPWVSHNL